MNITLVNIGAAYPVFAVEGTPTRIVLTHSTWRSAYTDDLTLKLTPEDRHLGDSCFMVRLDPPVAGKVWVKFEDCHELETFLRENL
jgi:hypothetical protein